MGNAGAAALAMRHGIHGHTFGVVSACAAGAHAIGTSVRMIQAGDADGVVAGGAEAALTGLAVAAFSAMGATSPSGISRPFDKRRDGFVMGEGAGVLVLEDAEAAEKRGAEVLGEVLGYAATSDAHHLTAPQPTGADASRAITLALEDADLRPADIDYVNAHGTSTPLNDRSETECLKAALGDDARRVPISSTKSAIGHLLGAAGAVEAIATVQALRRGSAPPTLGWEERDEGLDLDYVPGDARPLEPRSNGNGDRPLVAISNAFGFGGHNAVLCLTA
jgi:3-oxoacyl-[acyl-carrier-protein] synthase II